MRADLLQQTQLVAQAVNIERIKALSGTQADLKNAEYLRVKEQFSAVRTLYPQCRFAYLVGRNADGSFFFYLDSEPAESKDCSPPGQIYREAPHGLRRAFSTRNATVEGPYSDRWGTWVSALVPVHDPRTALYGLATPDDARALVRKAVDFYRRNGREHFLKEVSNPRGAFHRGDLYAFVYDRGMTMLAHPVKPELIGQNQLNMRDWAGGTFFRQEIRDVAHLKGSGWVDYEYENPVSKAIDSKTTYVEAVDDVIICAGAYKGSGAMLALLGMDIDARAWNARLARAALPPALLTLSLLTLLVAGSSLLERRTSLGASPRWMRHPEPLLVAAVGLVLTLFVAWVAYDREIHNRNESFAQLAKSRTETIANTLRELRATGIESLAHFYENSTRVTPDEFKRFSSYLTKNTSVQAWGWAPAVPVTERSRFEAATRAAGVKGFEIWQKNAGGQRASATGREMYYPVVHVTSLAGNERAQGYDIGSEPLRRAALEEAARTGLPTATDPITLLQQTGEQKGVLICRPVFSDGNRKRLRGFVIVALQMKTLLWSAPLDDSVPMGLSLLHSGARPELLAASWDTESPPGSRLSANRPVFAFGKVFAVTSLAGPEFMRLHTMLAVWISVVTGLVLTMVVTFMVGIILRRREELERLVSLRTSALRESKEHLSATLHSIGDGVIATDATGRVTNLNGVAERLTGWTTDEAMGKPVVDIFRIVHAKTRVTAENPVEQTLREGVVVDLSNNIVLIARGGVEYQVADSCAPILDADGHVIGAVLVFRDVTEEYRQREQLRASEEKHRTILQTTKAGFCLLDTRGNLLEVNEAFCRMSGYSAQELLDLRISDLDCTETDMDLTTRIRKIMAQGADSFESRHRRKDGSVFDVEISVQYLSAGEGWLVVFMQDVSERKQAEREKTKLESQLHQAQKMESVGRLAGGVAHDFNNMLSVILGHAELALMKSDPSQPLSANLKQIRDAAIRSADLTRQLLAFARQQAITPKVLDLNETVAGMLNMLQRLIGENIDLSWHPKANLWPVKVDPSQVDQILANLCVNARDAISGVGSLIIETGNCVLDDNFCADHVGFVAGEYVRLAVSDNGCGMDPETLEHIFEPFFTTKELGKGTGLGLSTVYGAVRQNNGFIDACSKPGRGTTFTIYLPRHAAGEEQALQPASVLPAARGAETILLVEDEPSILEMAATMLELQGYTVLPASTPGEAMYLSGVHAGKIHLLMTDVVMPEMNGRELFDRLLPQYPDLACLFMSGYTADVIAHHGVLNEGVHFIHKPFSIQSLAASVRNVLAAHSESIRGSQRSAPDVY
ncbi:MAG: PAS domain S-box protein [Desulfuromonadales bacterium]|nr:PAS domain S-box protein [Desulfuromonadales bacterium]